MRVIRAAARGQPARFAKRRVPQIVRLLLHPFENALRAAYTQHHVAIVELEGMRADVADGAAEAGTLRVRAPFPCF